MNIYIYMMRAYLAIASVDEEILRSAYMHICIYTYIYIYICIYIYINIYINFKSSHLAVSSIYEEILRGNCACGARARRWRRAAGCGDHPFHLVNVQVVELAAVKQKVELVILTHNHVQEFELIIVNVMCTVWIDR